MKVALLLLVLCAVAYAQGPGGGAHGGHASFEDFINHEVQVLLQNEPGLTVDECTTRCDEDFVLDADRLEHQTDDMCRAACEGAITPAS